jgi:hypothetical protein
MVEVIRLRVSGANFQDFDRYLLYLQGMVTWSTLACFATLHTSSQQEALHLASTSMTLH